MAKLHEDIEKAIAETLDDAEDQGKEFRKRFHNLIKNAADGPLHDSDVVQVIDLVAFEPSEEEDE